MTGNLYLAKAVSECQGELIIAKKLVLIPTFHEDNDARKLLLKFSYSDILFSHIV